jgi:hypothetical protein
MKRACWRQIPLFVTFNKTISEQHILHQSNNRAKNGAILFAYITHFDWLQSANHIPASSKYGDLIGVHNTIWLAFRLINQNKLMKPSL